MKCFQTNGISSSPINYKIQEAEKDIKLQPECILNKPGEA